MLTRILFELKTNLDDFILTMAPKIIKLITVVIIIFIFNTILIKGIENYIKNLKIDSVNSQFLYEVSSLAVKLLYLLFILKAIGVSQNTLLTIIGTIGLGISLSLQDSLSNFTSGFIVTGLKPFEIGHYIQVGDIVEGTVREINAFTIGLTSLDQNNVTLPNSFLLKYKIINFSLTKENTFRTSFEIPLNYNNKNINIVNEIENILKKNDKILENSFGEIIPSVRLIDLAEGFIKLNVSYYTRREDKFITRSQILDSINLLMTSKNIIIGKPEMNITLNEDQHK